MGKKMEYIYITDEWAAWQWANVTIDKKKSCNIETNYKHSKGGYGRWY